MITTLVFANTSIISQNYHFFFVVKMFKIYSLSKESRFSYFPFLSLYMSIQYFSFKWTILDIGKFFKNAEFNKNVFLTIQYECYF